MEKSGKKTNEQANLAHSFYYKKVPIKQMITFIGKMLKSSFPFCDSDQIAMSSTMSKRRFLDFFDEILLFE
jgi:hypothetical protein